MKTNIEYAYREKRPKGISIPTHRHPGPELVFYISAMGQTDIGGKSHRFVAGDVALIAADVPHSEQHTADGEVLFIRFAPTFTLPLPTGVYHTAGHRELFSVLQSIMQEIYTQRPGYREMLAYKTGELQVLLRRLQDDVRPPVRDLQYIIHYLNENFDQKIALNELADLCGYTYDYFRHLFKQHVGVSCMEYIMRLRFNAAEQALTATNRSLTEIAAGCGFWSSAQFSAMFKSRYGLSPKEYRKSAQNRV